MSIQLYIISIAHWYFDKIDNFDLNQNCLEIGYSFSDTPRIYCASQHTLGTKVNCKQVHVTVYITPSVEWLPWFTYVTIISVVFGILLFSPKLASELQST